jgi:hypothetical protein
MTTDEINTAGKQNKGFWFHRIKHPASKLEKALYKRWRKENTRPSGSTLPRLFYPQNPTVSTYPVPVVKITRRDRFIVATAIQWLGSNCGFCMLREALSDAGYDVVPKKKTVK